MKFNQLIKPNTTIEFVANRRTFAIVSGVLIVLSIVALLARGLNLGVDFKGGTKMVLSFKPGEPIDRELIRKAVSDMIVAETKGAAPQVEVQDFVAGSGDDEHLRYVIYTDVVTLLSEEQKSSIVAAVKEKYGDTAVVNPPEEGGDTFFVSFPVESNIKARTGELNDLFIAQGLKKVNVESDKVRDLNMEIYREANLVEQEGSSEEAKKAAEESRAAQIKRIEEFKETNAENSFTVRIEELTGKLEESIKASAGLAERFEAVESSASVSPSVGADLMAQGLIALLFACLGILLYIALRFDFKFGPGAVAALVHDSIITIGFFALFQVQFSMPIIAAIMTIIGYSVNDTIVVFDRIRENIGKYRGNAFDRIINKSINETLSRTLLTVGTTLLTVISIFILGGGLIKDFAFALIIGFVVGTYSSIFIASPMVLWLDGLVAKKGTTRSAAPTGA